MITACSRKLFSGSGNKVLTGWHLSFFFQPADEMEELKEEADEARRLAEEWEAKYKVGKGFKSW